MCACAAVLVLIGDGDVEPRAQVVGWPPVRNYRKNTLAASASKGKGEDKGTAEGGPLYVKVSMDGAPYLRKVDLKMYSSYEDLSMALEKMFSCFITGEHPPQRFSPMCVLLVKYTILAGGSVRKHVTDILRMEI